MMTGEMVMAVAAFALGLIILFYWRQQGVKLPKDYRLLVYVICLMYKEKLRKTKWYQFKKRRQIDAWYREEIRKAVRHYDDAANIYDQ
jgi:hypothetical protein